MKTSRPNREAVPKAEVSDGGQIIVDHGKTEKLWAKQDSRPTVAGALDSLAHGIFITKGLSRPDASEAVHSLITKIHLVVDFSCGRYRTRTCDLYNVNVTLLLSGTTCEPMQMRALAREKCSRPELSPPTPVESMNRPSSARTTTKPVIDHPSFPEGFCGGHTTPDAMGSSKNHMIIFSNRRKVYN